MSPRLSRAEQNDRNRALLLAAARRVFLARGYHAATLEQIADEAGFSKGAVYSRFDSKADMFLALLTDRIAERAAQNAAAAGQLARQGCPPCMSWHGGQNAPIQAGGCWSPSSGCTRPGIQNSTAATRLPMQTTVEGVASAVASAAGRNGHAPALPARQIAELLLAIETGLSLEQLANPGAVSLLQLPSVLAELSTLFAGSPASGEIPEVSQP